jgi:hypothetical protein
VGKTLLAVLAPQFAVRLSGHHVHPDFVWAAACDGSGFPLTHGTNRVPFPLSTS